MPHGADLLRCLERVRSAQNTEESTSCTLSIKIEPDTRGLVPGIHVFMVTAAKEDVDGRDKPGHDAKIVSNPCTTPRPRAIPRLTPSASTCCRTRRRGLHR